MNAPLNMPRRDPSTFDHPPDNHDPNDPFDVWVKNGCQGEPSGFVPGARVYSKLHGFEGVIQEITQKGEIYFRADEWPAEAATLHDRRHLSQIAKPSGGVIYPGKASRVEGLACDMQPLHAVKPVLLGRYLVKGWLDRGASSVVYGESNVGKTFFAMDLAFHVAARLPWHGVKVAGMGGSEWPGKVYYLALEGGSGFINRICAMRQERPDIFERIEDDGDFVPWPTSIDLHGMTDGEAIAAAIEECQQSTALVVIDTLARAMGDGDENTAKDMGQFVRNVDLIRERTGAHVMVIHHSGKDTSKGAMRVAARVRRPGYAQRYPHQFTIRSQVASGAQTELSKIVNGNGDWMFYGHSNAAQTGLDAWWLIDLNAFRAGLIRKGADGLQWGNKSNADGTRFTWFDVRSFPAEPPLVVASSGQPS